MHGGASCDAGKEGAAIWVRPVALLPGRGEALFGDPAFLGWAFFFSPPRAEELCPRPKWVTAP